MNGVAERQLPPSDRSELPEDASATRPYLGDASSQKLMGPALGQPLGALLSLKESAQIDQGLQGRINARLAMPNISQSDIARSARISGSMLSKWLNNKPEGDWQKLQEVLNKWDLEFDEREDLKRDIKPTLVTDWVVSVITRMARRKALGVLTAPAGTGKTCGCQLYCADNPRAVMLTAGVLHGNAAAMVNELWQKSRARRRISEKGLSQAEILKLRWKGSDAPIIIDEFDKLTVSGFGWVKDFFDFTACPILLTGNYRGLEKIRRLPDADQWTSRIREDRKLQLGGSPAHPLNAAARRQLAALMIEQYAPDFRSELLEAAIVVVGKKGYARRLKFQLQMALDLMDGDKSLTAREAFQMAPTQMLTLDEN